MTVNKMLLVGLAMATGWLNPASALTVEDNFESGEVGKPAANWVGGTVEEMSGSYAKVDMPGYPLPSADHTKMLAIAGSAERTYGDDETGDRVIDMMILVNDFPEEELPSANGDEQIKVAFDSEGYVNVYCTPANAEAPAWKRVSKAAYSAGSWVRVTCLFKYPASSGKAFCQVRLDGSPVVSEFGYQDANDQNANGSWYKTAKDCSSLSKIDFVGSGAVDDVVNGASDENGAYEPKVPEGAPTATNGVEYAWFNRWGLAWSDGTDTTPGGNGYTLKKAYECGLNPFTEDPFYISSAATNVEGKLVLKINGYDAKGYKVYVSDVPFDENNTGTECNCIASDSATSSENWTILTLDIDTIISGKSVAYFTVRPVKTTSAVTENQFVIQKYTSAEANTLIALPWRAISANVNSPAAIKAADVLVPKNLASGDGLIYYDNGGYKGWTWNGSAWTATASASVGGVEVSAAADTVTLERGRALWYVRSTENERDLSLPFYLWGQYQAGKGSVKVAAGGALLANPDVSQSFDLADKNFGTNGDIIQVPVHNAAPKRFHRKEGTWGYFKESTETIGERPVSVQTWTTEGADMEIPAGQGFIYQGKESAEIAW